MRGRAAGGLIVAGLALLLVHAALADAPPGDSDEPGQAAGDVAVTQPDMPPPPPALAEPGALPAASGALVLDADRQNSTSDCAGHDVLIHASFSHIVLRGGCRSVLVQGQEDTIIAEMLPGGRIGIGGASVRLDYTVVAQGRPVTVSATATGAAVFQHPR